HWGTEDGPNNIQQSVIGGTLTNYKSWRDSLNKFKSYDLRTPRVYNYAIHLSSEQTNYYRTVVGDPNSIEFTHNQGYSIPNFNGDNLTAYEFPYSRFIKPYDSDPVINIYYK